LQKGQNLLGEIFHALLFRPAGPPGDLPIGDHLFRDDLAGGLILEDALDLDLLLAGAEPGEVAGGPIARLEVDDPPAKNEDRASCFGALGRLPDRGEERRSGHLPEQRALDSIQELVGDLPGALGLFRGVVLPVDVETRDLQRAVYSSGSRSLMSPRRAFLSCIILLAALASAAVADPRMPGTPRPLEIRLAGGTIRPSEGQPLKSDDLAPGWYRVAAVAPLEASARGFKYLAAVARGPLSPEERLRLEAAGVQVLDYLPVHAYRLRVQLGAEANVRSLPFVAWLGDLPRHLKIEPQLARLASGQNEDADV